MGPILLTSALYKYLKLKDTKHLIYVSSLSGSITGYIPLSSSAYGQSKAGLNYFVKEVANELEGEGFTTIAVHPGVVNTDSFKEALKIAERDSPQVIEIIKSLPTSTAEECAKQLVGNVFSKIIKEQNSKFLNYDGEELPY